MQYYKELYRNSTMNHLYTYTPYRNHVQLLPERKNHALQIHVCWATETLGRL